MMSSGTFMTPLWMPNWNEPSSASEMAQKKYGRTRTGPFSAAHWREDEQRDDGSGSENHAKCRRTGSDSLRSFEVKASRWFSRADCGAHVHVSLVPQHPVLSSADPSHCLSSVPLIRPSDRPLIPDISLRSRRIRSDLFSVCFTARRLAQPLPLTSSSLGCVLPPRAFRPLSADVPTPRAVLALTHARSSHPRPFFSNLSSLDSPSSPASFSPNDAAPLSHSIRRTRGANVRIPAINQRLRVRLVHHHGREKTWPRKTWPRDSAEIESPTQFARLF